MDFGLSQDQVLLKDAIRRYLESECPTSRVRAIMEGDTGHDPRLWDGLAELGVAGLHVPVAHGGSGLELLDVALAAEELGWASTPGPFLACSLATAALVAGGTDEAPGLWLVERGATGLGVTPLAGTDMTRRVDAVELSGTPATKVASGRAPI